MSEILKNNILKSERVVFINTDNAITHYTKIRPEKKGTNKTKPKKRK